MKLKIKRGDEALVIAGSEKGKRAKVLEMDMVKLKARLQGVRVQTHFDKKEGIQKKEGWIDYSNIRLVNAAAQNQKSKKSKK
ncbi:MAG: KOW motif domain-containing protein [Bdellovibrionales bacterium]|nr:KOW motif domain-containing protein [Bdellovibrionales bacterium]